MFQFWEIALAPVVQAARADKVVYIGALDDANRNRLLDLLGADTELHVIDPSVRSSERPDLEPSKRCIVHRARSLDVLAELPPVDVALVDGDHNWYTVSRELELLTQAARADGRAAPVLVLHDVCWPYGRRDLYDEPSLIPEQFRLPFARGGVRPGSPGVFRGEGFNHNGAHAQTEGGPRNGVMTAIDDFVAGSDRSFRQVVLPVGFGLAIVVEEDRLRAAPAIGDVLDRLELPAGREELLRLSERTRVEAAVSEHDRVRKLRNRLRIGASRYLEILKGGLLDEHYLENEVRIEYLASLHGGAGVDLSVLRDPVRHLPVRYDFLAQARRGGWSPPEGRNVAYFPFTAMGRQQLDHLQKMLTALRDEGVGGDLAEFGVGRGGGSIFLRGFLEAHDIPGRQVWVADRFLGSEPAEPGDDPGPAGTLARFGADLNQVRDGFARFDLLDARVRFLQGLPQDVLRDAPIDRLALLRIGRTIGSSLGPVLDALHVRIEPRGAVIVEGTSDPSVMKAVDDARERLGVTAPLERIDWNAVAWRVGVGHGAVPVVRVGAGAAAPPADVLHRAPLLAAAGTDRVALSVLVVFYNMRREAARTLLSLSRSYQRGLDAIDYEVIAIDNGSAPEERLDESFVESFGPEFRLLDLSGDARPSPTAALNQAAALARGESLAFMIDGAHMLTPGVLRLGLTALSTYAPAVVATQQWYLGPGQQGDALHAGYDQATEDRLLARINWPIDGYRLFEIGHFIGYRDWFDGLVESNCLFVPRELLEQFGGFDDSFSMPGGGYANLDLFERLGAAPGVQVASILGEGTFHQVHGGTTTNVADAAVRRDLVASYGDHFAELRGRGLVGLTKPVHFVGSMATKAARRTRSRHEISFAFDPLRDPVSDTDDTGMTQVPDELKRAAIEAVWHSGAWRSATWLGYPVARLPTDLYSYQELLTRVRPAVVIVAGDDAGLVGRALFFAAICDQLGHGRVVAVGRAPTEAPLLHERIEWVEGAPEGPAVAEAVRETIGDAVDAVVFLGLGAVERVIGAFELYAPLVPVDSYVVVENTVVNGRPVASEFGPGPYEAVVSILGRHHEFMTDPSFERYTLTFNPGGFLRRVRPSTP